MESSPRQNLFDLDQAVKNPLAKSMLKVVGKPLAKMLALERVDRYYQSVPPEAVGLDFVRHVIRSFDFRPEICAEDLARIPKEGPVVVVANHPFGCMEGLLLADLLLSVRPDVKIMANYLLSRVPEMAGLFIYVDPFGSQASMSRNIAPLRQSLGLLRQGGLLGVFPAGEVAHFNMRERRVIETQWSPSIARLIKASGATVVPVHFAGANGAAFQMAGLVHPRLRTMLLAREFVNKSSKTVRVRVGAPLAASRLEGLSDEQAMEVLRLRAEVLGGDKKGQNTTKLFPVKVLHRREALIAPKSPELMEREVAALAPERLLVESGEFRVYEAKAKEIPLILREIGRLREVTFRKVGEGSGKACDLDWFDGHYRHVFIWNVKSHEVVGAYRLGRTDEIMSRFGSEGLYVTTLFKLKPGFLTKLGPALEMGRSFVRPEYQKSYNALLLLWRGIGQVVAREPRYRKLFGPVSITNEYQVASRQLIASYFESKGELPQLSRLVKPRSPLRGKGWLKKAAKALVADVDSLSELISDIEASPRGIPVLLRQYLKLGGKLLAFNVDREFSDALDGLIVVDLLETDRKQLERYLGKQGLEGFLRHHGLEGLLRTA